MKPKIGITVGDLAGIGLEIIQKSIPQVIDICDCEIIGKQLSPEEIEYGKVNTLYGGIAGEAIKEAVNKALNKKIDAIVTAPICKEALNKAGFHYAGHTEMLADLTGMQQSAMMLVHKNLRVAHVTTHQSLSKAIDSLTIDRILWVINLANTATRKLGVMNPRIGVAAVNPHGGEEGLFGYEEKYIIEPAINRAIESGIGVHPKPIPSDVIFAKAYGGAFDCVVAMYHDQGHIPIKTLGFKWDGVKNEWGEVDGVNVTLGLPIIRTSPDHGVAFGKAGKGIADPSSMISAIKIAVDLVKNKEVLDAS